MNDLQLDENVIELDWNLSQKCSEKVQSDLKNVLLEDFFY